MYTGEFNSLCTLQSSASHQQTREPQESHRKSLLLLQLFCSTLQALHSTDSPGVLHTGCPVHRCGGSGIKGLPSSLCSKASAVHLWWA